MGLTLPIGLVQTASRGGSRKGTRELGKENKKATSFPRVAFHEYDRQTYLGVGRVKRDILRFQRTRMPPIQLRKWAT